MPKQYFNAPAPSRKEFDELADQIGNYEQIGSSTAFASKHANLTGVLLKYGRVAFLKCDISNFSGSNQLIGTLKSDYYPKVQRAYAVAINNDTSAVVGTIYVNTTGEVYYYGPSLNGSQLTFSAMYIV